MQGEVSSSGSLPLKVRMRAATPAPRSLTREREASPEGRTSPKLLGEGY